MNTCEDVQWINLIGQIALVVSFLILAGAFNRVMRLIAATHMRVDSIAKILEIEPKIDELERRAAILVDKGFKQVPP